jgi:lysophospholipid hydrolase
VVLSGGAARGLAHIGFLRGMEERGLPIDFIGGTSQGAFMGGLYAMHMSADACAPGISRLASAIGSTSQLIQALTLPVISYFSGHAMNAVLIDVFTDTQIEDLWLRYFAVSTDVTESTMRVHSTGPLWRYARASMNLMGLLPPVFDRGHLLVDGGYCAKCVVRRWWLWWWWGWCGRAGGGGTQTRRFPLLFPSL